MQIVLYPTNITKREPGFTDTRHILYGDRRRTLGLSDLIILEHRLYGRFVFLTSNIEHGELVRVNHQQKCFEHLPVDSAFTAHSLTFCRARRIPCGLWLLNLSSGVDWTSGSYHDSDSPYHGHSWEDVVETGIPSDTTSD